MPAPPEADPGAASGAPAADPASDPGGLALGLLLVALAGFVDAVAFLGFSGVYASFMSGDSTQLGAALGRRSWADAALFLSVAALFVLGAACGRALRTASVRRGRAAVLLLTGLALAGAAASGRAGWSACALILCVLAMGAQNAAIHRAGSTVLTPTYVTGALVRVGEALADRLLGRGPGRLWSQLGQWLGLVAGAAAGACAYGRWGAEALIAPALAALGLAAALAIGESFRRVSGRPAST